MSEDFTDITVALHKLECRLCAAGFKVGRKLSGEIARAAVLVGDSIRGVIEVFSCNGFFLVGEPHALKVKRIDNETVGGNRSVSRLRGIF